MKPRERCWRPGVSSGEELVSRAFVDGSINAISMEVDGGVGVACKRLDFAHE